MFRLSCVRTAVVLALFGWAGPARAQFYPTIAPPNPLYQHPAYRYQFSVGVAVPTVYGRAFVGMTAPATRAPQLFSPNLYVGPTGTLERVPWMSSRQAGTAAPTVGSGYITAGGIPNSAFLEAQRELERQQREMAAARLRARPEAARDAIYEQWAYEKLGVMGLPALSRPNREQPEELARALAAQTAEEVADGQALNHILVAIVAAETAGAKGLSLHVPPQLLDQIRFGGSPTAEAVNLIRRAGRLPFPPAFDEPALRDLREALEKDFLDAAGPLREGKPAVAAKWPKLERTLRQAQEAVTPVVRNLPFEEAMAVRRFLNRFETALPVLKSNAAAGLVNPAWAREGVGLAELIRYMTRHKLLFGPAAAGDEGGYLAMHQRLATYFVSLGPAVAKK